MADAETIEEGLGAIGRWTLRFDVGEIMTAIKEEE